MNTPLVSIVVPCYNHGHYVRQCIESIAGQSYENIELVIIDDGSTDDSVDQIQALAALCEARFARFVFVARPNKGLCATLNEAIELCRGKYYSAIASDDLMLVDKTRLQVDYLESHPQCSAVFGGVNVIDATGKTLCSKPSKVGSFDFKDLLLVRHSLSAPTQMIRMDALRQTGLYKVGLFVEDWYMWLKMAHAGGRLDDIGIPLAAYRRHDSNISSQLVKMNEARRQIIDEYKGHRLYNQAVAVSRLSSALDVQPYDKVKSLRFAMAGLGQSVSLLVDLRFYWYLVKFFLPKRYLSRRNGVDASD